jgi:hypothetical protein
MGFRSGRCYLIADGRQTVRFLRADGGYNFCFYFHRCCCFDDDWTGARCTMMALLATSEGIEDLPSKHMFY